MNEQTQKDRILARSTLLPREAVVVPEWNETVYVRRMTLGEREEFEEGAMETNGKAIKVNLRNVRSRLVSMALVDEAGAQLFTVADALRLDSLIAMRLVDVALRVNAMAADDVEEIAKNCESAPNVSFSTV